MVRLVGKPDKTDEKIKYDAVHTDLYPIVSQFFKALNIRKIDITDGFFDFHTKITDDQRFGISKIDITLRNFYLNEEKFLALLQPMQRCLLICIFEPCLLPAIEVGMKTDIVTEFVVIKPRAGSVEVLSPIVFEFLGT